MNLFRENFVFNATHYEVWQDQQCISKGNSPLKIVGIYTYDYMSFQLIGDLKLSIERGFSIKGSAMLEDRIQYGRLPVDMNTKYPTLPKVCNLFSNETCVRFALLSPLRIIEFYGSYDKNAQISPIETDANQLILHFRKNENFVSEARLLLQNIKYNPKVLLGIKKPQAMAHAMMIILFSNITNDLDTLELAGDIGYWSISKAIENDPNNINLYLDRLTLMIQAPEAMKWSAMASLKLATSSANFLGGGTMAELRARDAVLKMTIADMYYHPDTYKLQEKIFRHKIDMDKKIANNFFRLKTKRQNRL